MNTSINNCAVIVRVFTAEQPRQQHNTFLFIPRYYCLNEALLSWTLAPPAGVDVGGARALLLPLMNGVHCLLNTSLCV